MPKGLEGVREASQRIQAAKNRFQENTQSALWFRLSPGDETIVRFLEEGDDIHWAMMHEVPVEGRKFGRWVPCLDQDEEGLSCPGCDREYNRKFMGYINVIWDDAPVFKRDENNRLVRDDNRKPVVIDKMPQVAIWSSGIRLFEELDEINTNFRGLSSRRFRVKRKGEGLDTKYVISPEDIDSGPQPMTNDEKALAADKFDLNVYVVPGADDGFTELDGPNGVTVVNNASTNPFMRK